MRGYVHGLINVIELEVIELDRMISEFIERSS